MLSSINLISEVSLWSGEDRATCERVVAALVKVMTSEFADGQTVHITGIGRFTVVQRAARKGRDPRTLQPITIPPKRTVKFKPVKAIQEALNPSEESGS